MKKFYILVFIILVIFTGCENKKEELKNEYLTMKSDLLKSNSFSSSDELPCDIEVNIDRVDEEIVSYEVDVFNCRENMNNVKAILVHNYYTEDVFPSLGLFDEPINLVKEDNNSFILKGDIKTNNDIDNLNLVLKLYIKYVDDNGIEKDIKRQNKYLFFVNIIMVNYMKVKIFDESHESDLEDDINKFIKDEEPEIIDIKFGVSNSIYSEEQLYCFSALIIYNDN